VRLPRGVARREEYRSLDELEVWSLGRKRAIRGREQQLIDFRGGSQSDVSPPRTENR